MSTADKLLSRLLRVKQSRSGSWRAQCPAHGGRRDALAITETADGVVLLKCFAGCDVDEILRAVGMSASELFPPKEYVSYDCRQPQHRIPYENVLACLSFSVRIISIAASTIRRGHDLSAEDWQVFDEAVRNVTGVEGMLP